MNLTPSLSIKDEFVDSYRKNGFVLFNDLIRPEQATSIRSEFLAIAEDLSKRYKIEHTSEDPVRRAYEVFAVGGVFRRHIYGYSQQLRSITSLVGSDGFTQVFKKMGLRFPVLRNQALRIDFPDEPQFLQGIHQDVRGMRSSNCLNFWICLQDVDEHKGTLSVWPGSHMDGPVVPKHFSSEGYQIFTEEEVSHYQKDYLRTTPGHVLMFHPYLYHGSHQTQEKTLRLTVTLRYDDIGDMEWLREQDCPFEKLNIQDRTRFKTE